MDRGGNNKGKHTYPYAFHACRQKANCALYPYCPGRDAIDEGQREVLEAQPTVSFAFPRPFPRHLAW